jgi:hypothetical protein
MIYDRLLHIEVHIAYFECLPTFLNPWLKNRSAPGDELVHIAGLRRIRVELHLPRYVQNRAFDERRVFARDQGDASRGRWRHFHAPEYIS